MEGRNFEKLRKFMDSFKSNFAEVLPAYMQVKMASFIKEEFGIPVFFSKEARDKAIGEETEAKPHFLLEFPTTEEAPELKAFHFSFDLALIHLQVSFSVKPFPNFFGSSINEQIERFWRSLKSYSALKLFQCEKNEINEKLSSESLMMHFNNKTQLKSVNVSKLEVLSQFLRIPDDIRDFSDITMKKVLRNPIVAETVASRLDALKKTTTRSFSNFRPNFTVVFDYDIRKRAKGFTLIFSVDSKAQKLSSRDEIIRAVDYVINNDDLNKRGEFQRKKIRSVTFINHQHFNSAGNKASQSPSDNDSVVTEKDIKETIINEYIPDLQSPKLKRRVKAPLDLNKGAEASETYSLM